MSKDTSINKKNIEFSKADKNYPINAEIPNNIMVELTNSCNLKCNFCYNMKMKRKKGFMTFDLFKKIVNQSIELGVENMGLYTVGESFLHPQIFDFIKYAKQKGIKYIYITTNGQVLNKNKIEKIFDSGLNSIKFSIDAGNKEKYETLKIGANWNKLIEVIKEIRTIRDNSNSDLKIFASFTVMTDNFDELKEYNNTFANLIDETNFSLVENQGSQVDTNSFYSKDIASVIENIILPIEKWHPCGMLWNRFIVTYEGYLTICCVDFENQLLYGDISKESLAESWNNEKIKNYRKIHKLKEFKKLPMCYNCDSIKRDEKIDINKLFSL